MKRSLISFFAVLRFTAALMAQTGVPPNGINYQAVIRDSVTGKPVEKSGMIIEFSLRDVSSQTQEYVELHNNISSNKYGLINLIIGSGTYSSGITTRIDMIRWFNDQYEVRIRVDTGGLAGYDFEIPYTKLWSVPYSFYSRKSMFADSTIKATYADTAKKIAINAIPDRLVKIGPNGKYIKHSHITEDTLTEKIGFGLGLNNAGFHVKNEFGKNGFVVEGTMLGGSFPNFPSVQGTRLMWIPIASAFRVGTLLQDSAHLWDASNTGLYSLAMGLNVEAKGNVSLSMGYNTKASGAGSAAIGGYSNAFGAASVAMGGFVNAFDSSGFVLGTGYNLNYPLNNNKKRSLMIGFNSDKPTLFISPASGPGYWGRVGIGTAKPLAQLHINDTIGAPVAMIVESQNQSTEIQLRSKQLLSNSSIRLTYTSNEGEKAALHYDKIDNFFKISTDTHPRIKITGDPADENLPYVGIGNNLQADSNVRLAIENGHIQSFQSQAISIGTSSLTGGTTITRSTDPVSTDVAGQIKIATLNSSLGPQFATFNFSKPYNSLPIMVISPANKLAAEEMGSQKIYIIATNTSFTVHMDTPNPTKSGTFLFNYLVIETK